DAQANRATYQQAGSEPDQARERSYGRRAGDHPEVAARGDAADRERGMAGLVVDVGEEQRPHDRDTYRGRREPGGRDAGRAAKRVGRDARGRERSPGDNRPPGANRG